MRHFTSVPWTVLGAVDTDISLEVLSNTPFPQALDEAGHLLHILLKVRLISIGAAILRIQGREKGRERSIQHQ